MKTNDKILINQFGNIHQNYSNLFRYWFWENMDWSKYNIWIGHKYDTSYCSNLSTNQPSLSPNPQQWTQYITDLCQQLQVQFQHQVVIKTYITDNYTENRHSAYSLIITDKNTLLPDFIKTHFYVYQLTQDMVNNDNKYNDILNHYILWSNVYQYQSLIDTIITTPQTSFNTSNEVIPS